MYQFLQHVNVLRAILDNYSTLHREYEDHGMLLRDLFETMLEA